MVLVPNPAVRTGSSRLTHGVRPEWLFEVTTLLQRALCEGAFAANDSDDALLRIVERLPAPCHRVEELVLSGLLMEVLWGERGSSHRVIKNRIRRLASATGRRPALSLAKRAADYISHQGSSRLRLPHIARALGCDESRLRREFRREYRMSPSEYCQRVRLQRALMLMADSSSKVAGVARTGGYRSESHFHVLVRRYTGQTPAALQALERDALAALTVRIVPHGADPAATTQSLAALRVHRSWDRAV
jgi:AraC-like DNA-binding protein